MLLQKREMAAFYTSYRKMWPYEKLTNNVPVVFMARYVMILRGATSLRGALEGVGPEN
jgi:hypothetical protein